MVLYRVFMLAKANNNRLLFNEIKDKAFGMAELQRSEIFVED
jgi:hypothetical protein